MATGTAADMLRRLTRLIPSGWFGDTAPIRDIVLGGIADALAWIYAQATIVRAGTRRAGATGWLLDLDAFGFFGARYLRRPSEGDDSWRRRWTAEIFRPRVTRAALTQVVTDLTGNAPQLVELWNPGDCGAYDTGTLAYAGEASGTGPLAGYDTALGGYDAGAFAYVDPVVAADAFAGAGCWGSYDFPNQILITAFRTPQTGPAGTGFYDTPTLAYGGGDLAPSFFGYDTAPASYDAGSLGYLMPNPPYGIVPGAGYWAEDGDEGGVTDAEIYAGIASVMAAGTIGWARIETAAAA